MHQFSQPICVNGYTAVGTYLQASVIFGFTSRVSSKRTLNLDDQKSFGEVVSTVLVSLLRLRTLVQHYSIQSTLLKFGPTNHMSNLFLIYSGYMTIVILQ